MSSVRQQIDVLLNASISRGEVSSSEVSAAANALINDSNLKPDELLPLFEVIPREAISSEVFQALIPKFLDAEEKLGRIDASKSLVVSGFRGCAPQSGKIFTKIASTCLNRVALKEGVNTANEELFSGILNWSLRVLASAAAENMTEEAVGRANTVIAMTLKKSSYFFFAPVVDALRAVKKILPANINTVVEGLLEDVLVQANGITALEAFMKKSSAELDKIFAAAQVSFEPAALQRKVRMIALTKILRPAAAAAAGSSSPTATTTSTSTSRTVSFSEVASGLGGGVSEELAENTVIDAATADLVSVQIDRAEKKIRVMDTAVLRFDKGAWMALKKRVESVVAVTDKLASSYELPQ